MFNRPYKGAILFYEQKKTLNFFSEIIIYNIDISKISCHFLFLFKYYSMRNKGFTLIELVIVIVVLGILSATAVPKFMNLQDDARLATFKSEGAAIKSGLELVHKKAIIGPITDGKLTINGEFITINPKTMYPIFLEENLEKQIMAFVDIDLSRYDVEYYKTGFMMYPNTFTPENEKYCLIEYAYDKFNIDTTSCFTGL